MTARHRRHGESSTCPKCNAVSPLTDWDEVDVGVGVITGNDRFECPEHGEWTIGQSSGQPIFRDELDPEAEAAADTAAFISEIEASR